MSSPAAAGNRASTNAGFRKLVFVLKFTALVKCTREVPRMVVKHQPEHARYKWSTTFTGCNARLITARFFCLKTDFFVFILKNTIIRTPKRLT
jgi:hypothetical protein